MDFLHISQDVWEAGAVNIAICFALLAVTYTIFSMMGFGSAVIAAPVLALRLPMTTIVPLLSLLDLAAALLNIGQLSSKIEKKELFMLAPLMAAGSGVGIYLLMVAAPQYLMLGLGLFVIVYSLYRLFGRLDLHRLPALWVLPFGLIGGLFSGMFGSGGFIFSIYLSHRLNDKHSIRATMTAMTAISTFFRAAVFLTIGTYADRALLTLVALGLPAVILGLFCGHRIALRISHAQFLRILCLMLIVTGGSLVWRSLHA